MDKKVEAKKEYTAEQFAAALDKLCREYGYTVQPTAGFKQQIDGTFTISVQLQVAKLQEK